MKRSFLFWMATWLAVGLSAPASAQPQGLDLSKACAQWRWIGIGKAEGRCPEIPGWTAQPLFPALLPPNAADDRDCPEEAKARGACIPDSKLLRELKRFCVYEADGGTPPPPVSAGLIRIDPDCAALSLSGTAVTAVAARDRLAEQTGRRTLAIDNPGGVRLAFLDTEPTWTEIPKQQQGASPHGYTLARVAQAMLCDRARCAAHITSQLALPIVRFDPGSRKSSQIDAANGGFLGFQSDLAQAVQVQVDAWRQARQKLPESHLVLNLSLAWDGRLFGGLDEDTIAEMRAGTQAVYRALQYANGFDVLVLAAAGNRKAQPCDNRGPLLPAAWEIGTQREESCGGRRRAPLVYAVGGVQSDGQRLVNSRPRGMPRRAAYGENAPVPERIFGGMPMIITGSSVSTAVVSAIAAAVWSSFPDRSSREVMGLLDESGDPLHMAADFWFVPDAASAGPFRVHRLSLCNALQTARDRWNTGTAKADFQCDAWKPVQSLAVPKNWVPDSCDPWVRPQPETPPSLSSGSGLIPPP